jgi:hypothetical protein
VSSEQNNPASVATVQAQASGGIPDVEFIKTRIPVADVAVALGLEVRGDMARCWRTENHQHGDRTPSMGIYRKRNLIRCFVCDDRAYSAIDLVQKVLGLDTRAAINWIAARFEVPSIPKGRHLPKADPFRSVSRVGLGGLLEQVIRSGLWASLTPSERSILPVLCELRDSTKDAFQMSYRGIRRKAGVRSDTTVCAALHHFEQLHLLKIHRAREVGGLLRACNSYELTFDDPRLLELMAEFYQCEQKEIEAERQSRQELRNIRRRVLAKKPKKNDTSDGIPDPDQLPTSA